MFAILLTNVLGYYRMIIVADAASVRLAQLDRAFGYGPKGRGFESSSARLIVEAGMSINSAFPLFSCTGLNPLFTVSFCFIFLTNILIIGIT